MYLSVDKFKQLRTISGFLDNIYEVTKKKSKDYYTLLVSRKALFPTIVNKLQNEFHFTLEEVKKIL